MKIVDFLDQEYVNHASYTTIRGIPSFIDGLKNASRKCVWTMMTIPEGKRNRVDMFSNKVIEHTKYIHGSCETTVVIAAKDFVGYPFPLFKSHGFFGSRLVNEAAATRYIEVSSHPNMKLLIDPADTPNLIHQVFDGYEIEPRFLMPALPIALLKGAFGVSTGFKSVIFPRKLDSIVKYIQGKTDTLIPYIEGYDGVVTETEQGHFTISGTFTRRTTTEVVVTEIPTGIELSKYVKLLITLKEDKKIQSFKDVSDTKLGKFKFIIKFQREALKKTTDKQLIKMLKLEKTVKEIYTFLDEDNHIIIFDSIYEMLDRWMEVKKGFERKKQKQKIKDILLLEQIADSKVRFIKDVLSGKVVVAKSTKPMIEKSLIKLSYKRVDGKFDYLLNMPIYNLSQTMINKLETQLSVLTDKLAEESSKDAVDEWMMGLRRMKNLS